MVLVGLAVVVGIVFLIDRNRKPTVSNPQRQNLGIVLIVGFIVFLVSYLVINIFFLRWFSLWLAPFGQEFEEYVFLVVPLVVGLLAVWLRARAEPQYTRIWTTGTWTLIGLLVGFVVAILIDSPSLESILILAGVFAVVGGIIGWAVTTPPKPKESLPPPLYTLLRITVPPISWEPQHASGLMNTLFSLSPYGSMDFRIVATNTRIVWELQIPQVAADTVNRAILSFYPHADIEAQEDERADSESKEEEHESTADKQWVTANLKVLATKAKVHLTTEGRGCVVVDILVPSPFSKKDAFWYETLDKLEEEQDRAVLDLVQAYNPNEEMVVVLLKAGDERMINRFPLTEDKKETEQSSQQSEDEGVLTYLRGGVEYFAPLNYVHDLKTLDPLASIVGAMGQLRDGERVVYSLVIEPTQTDYRQEGYKKIHRSKAPMILSMAAAAASTRPIVHVGQKSLDKYEARYQHAFEEKLASPLLPATLRIYVRSFDPQRFATIRDGISIATTVFDRPDGNNLTTHPQGLSLIISPQEAASLWHLPSDHIQTAGVVRVSTAKSPLPVELLHQQSGLLLGTNTYQGQTYPVYLAQQDRITHMNIVGKTRVGKTTFMHNLIHQDIAEGRGVAVIDPHGDLIQNILTSSIPPEREADVVLFDLADLAHPVALNLLYVPAGVSRHAAVGLTMGVLKKLFADQWSATRMEDALYSALAVLVDSTGATIRDIPKLFYEAGYRQKVLARASDKAALEYWREDFERMSERYQLEVARPIMHRIRTFYRNPVIEQIVVQPTSLDFRGMMDEGKIFLASLAGESTQAESAIIGALLISKLQMAAMSRAQIPVERRRLFYLYIDEVQNFITTSLSTMFSEAAKYALSLTVANQYLRQLAGDTLDAVIGNTGTTVMFASGPQDAQELGAYIKSTFDSQTLLNLDRFQTIVKMQHDGRALPAFSMQTLPPPDPQEAAVERVQRIRQAAQERQTPPAAPPAEDEEEVIDLTAISSTSDDDDDMVPDLER